MKRISIIKSIIFAAVALVAGSAWADSQKVGDYTWTYRLSDDTAEIQGISPEPTGAVTIPSTLGGKPVTSIGFWAFYGCSGLMSVTIPDGVTIIEDGAFVWCEGLTSVTIPGSVMSIGEGAFGRSGLTKVTIPDGVTRIGDYAFYYCLDLTSVTIPNTVTNIGEYAFDGCNGLKDVTVPQCICIIGRMSSVFASACQSITKVGISDGVTSIGAGAFQGCCGLTRVTIPASVTNIGYRAFEGCTSVTDVVVPGWTCGIPFGGVTNLVISDGVRSIGSSAFKDCSGLTRVPLAMAPTNGCYASRIENLPPELNGLSNADWSWHGAMDFDAFTEPSAEGNAAFRLVRHGNGWLAFWQVPPWAIDEGAKPYLRTTKRRAQYMLCRLLGNMECNFGGTAIRYADVPVAEDDPYRYYRW